MSRAALRELARLGQTACIDHPSRDLLEERGVADAQRLIDGAGRGGVGPEDLAPALERGGIAAFAASFEALLEGLRDRRRRARWSGEAVARRAGRLRAVVLGHQGSGGSGALRGL